MRATSHRLALPSDPTSIAPQQHGLLRRLTLLAFAVWALVACFWLARGYWALFATGGLDLEIRWQEINTMLAGLDPNTMFESLRTLGDDALQRRLEQLGIADLQVEQRAYAVGVYPPWSYVFALPLFATDSLAQARWHYAVAFALATVGCAFIAAWLARERLAQLQFGAQYTPHRYVAIASVAALFASASVLTDLQFGNWAMLTLLALFACLVAVRQQRFVLGGLLLGLAALKPTVSLPFGLYFLVKRCRWPGAVAAGVPIVVGALIHAWLTGTDPLTSFIGARSLDAGFASEGGGLPRVGEMIVGRYDPTILNGVYAFMLLLGFIALWTVRAREPLLQFAVLGIVSATWTYQRNYDYLSLSFLMLWLVPLALTPDEQGRVRWMAIGALALLGGTLWPPYRFFLFDNADVLRGAIWWCLLLAVIAGPLRTPSAHRPSGARQTG